MDFEVVIVNLDKIPRINEILPPKHKNSSQLDYINRPIYKYLFSLL